MRKNFQVRFEPIVEFFLKFFLREPFLNDSLRRSPQRKKP